MQNILKMLILAQVLACGSQESPNVLTVPVPPVIPVLNVAEILTKIKIESDLKPYLYEIVARCESSQEAKRNRCLNNLLLLESILYKDAPITKTQSTVGYCLKSETRRSIVIERNVYPAESHKLRFLMWHELGHCLFDFDHAETDHEIMSPVLPNEEFISEKWQNLAENYLKLDVFSMNKTECFLED